MVKLTHFSLFSGIGGIDLAAEAAGFRTVGQCEWADYPTSVLEKHWPHVPRWRDIRDVTAESFRERTGLRTVDIISGGFPCQPFSVAGKQKGKEDNRYLWPEMLRVIRELAPRWVLGENVPGILRIAADDICKDLEREGYDVGIFDYEAAAVGATHRRERIFFVGNAKHYGQYAMQELRGYEETSYSRGQEEQETPLQPTGTSESADVSSISRCESRGEWINDTVPNKVMEDTGSGRFCESDFCSEQQRGTETISTGKAMAHTDNRETRRRFGLGQKITDIDGARADIGRGAQEHVTGQRWHTESRLGGMVDELSCGMDGTVNPWGKEPDIPRLATEKKNRKNRLKALGNAVVPQQIYPILWAVAEVERGVYND